MNKPRRNAQRRKPQAQPGMSPLRAYGLGLGSGLLLALLIYLFSVPPQNPAPDPAASAKAQATQVEDQPAEPDYIFYEHLANQPAGSELPARPRQSNTRNQNADDSNMHYLLQAGSFRQAEDAERRRAELILLGLNTTVEAFEGSSGRLHRVYVGPFDSRAELSKARRLAATQNIETLILKRPRS